MFCQIKKELITYNDSLYSLLYDRLYTWLFAVFTDGSIDWYSLGDVGMFVSTELVSNDRASNLHIYTCRKSEALSLTQ